MPVTSDTTAFVKAVEQHQRILFKIAYAYCKKPADRADLIQDIWIALWQSFPKFNGQSHFSTWMYRVAVNIAISFYRNEGRRIRDAIPIDDVAFNLATADRAFDATTVNMQVLDQLLGQLDELNRALLILFLDGYSHADIAGIIGISPTNVSTRIKRIKDKLQQGFATT